jgi:cytochrome c oxidase subunit II
MSTSTGIVNAALIYISVISALLFAFIVFLMVYFTVRFRASRNPVPQEIKGSALLEIAWVVVPTIIVMTMFIYGLSGFQFLRAVPADSIHIKVHARQWTWLFEYGNGKKSANMVVPLGKNIACDLISADVIHGFYVPAYRIQEDIVPGLPTRVWFNATEPGSSYILCSQYCGLKHSGMIAKIYPVAPDQFEAWLKGKNIPLEDNGQFANMPAGERLMAERGCISCHSLYGNKMVGPTFKGLFGSTVKVVTANQPRSITADSNYIRESIIHPNADVTEGYPSTMPSGRDILSDAEIAEIVGYLKTLK